MKPIYPDINEIECGSRIPKTQKPMEEPGLDALLISSAVSSYYVGFAVPNVNGFGAKTGCDGAMNEE